MPGNAARRTARPSFFFSHHLPHPSIVKPSRNEHFDTVIIGCGMSGLAAGIRLALFDKRVLIVERHNAPGGLNSFYSRHGRRYDVGLHAMTNFVREGVKGTPLQKLLRQLRIPREAFDLNEQVGSRIAFPGVDLRFDNDFNLLESEVARAFPAEIDGFRALDRAVAGCNETALDFRETPAREIIRRHIRNPLLEDMLLCPLMYYGSAREDDMDFSQFCIMWKSIYREGFCRPFDGVRVIIRALLDQYRSLGGQRLMKCGVRRLHAEDGRVASIELDDGTCITADQILSSAGSIETRRLCDDQPADAGSGREGFLSYVETITAFRSQPADWGWKETIVFFNEAPSFEYRRPADSLVDPRSGVICLPNNYRFTDGRRLPEGLLRVTALANAQAWAALPPDAYARAKAEWFATLGRTARRILGPVDEAAFAADVLDTDMFTPSTVERFTGHINGAIYGAPDKAKDGSTHLRNLHLCGTDQGFLGIVGAMLSGISMANLHVLQGRS